MDDFVPIEIPKGLEVPDYILANLTSPIGRIRRPAERAVTELERMRKAVAIQDAKAPNETEHLVAEKMDQRNFHLTQAEEIRLQILKITGEKRLPAAEKIKHSDDARGGVLLKRHAKAVAEGKKPHQGKPHDLCPGCTEAAPVLAGLPGAPKEVYEHFNLRENYGGGVIVHVLCYDPKNGRVTSWCHTRLDRVVQGTAVEITEKLTCTQCKLWADSPNQNRPAYFRSTVFASTVGA